MYCLEFLGSVIIWFLDFIFIYSLLFFITERYDSDYEMTKPRYPIPILTFGTEQEYSYAIRRSIFNSWLEAGSPESPSKPKSPRKAISTRNEGLNETQSHTSKLPSPTFSEITNDSRIQKTLRSYMIDLLNHEVPGRPGFGTPSALPIVVSEDEPKRPAFTYSSWSLTTEVVLNPRTAQFATRRGETQTEVKMKWLLGANELVAPIMNFEDMASWLPMYEQIENDLAWDVDNQGFFINGFGGVHVHFASVSPTLSLPTLQNLLALYGLFTDEISSWLHTRRRSLPYPFTESTFCASLRLGMEIDQGRKSDTWIPLPEYRYTPQQYTERVYATNSITNLTREVSGWPKIPLAFGAPDASDSFFKDMTVFISPARANKVLTVEFRQLEASVCAKDIKWWILFCGRLLSYSYLLSQQGVQVRDKEGGETTSFVEEITKTSILDMISFPEEGKEHFRKKKEREFDERAEMVRKVEEMVIKERVRRRKRGEVTGREMDGEIMGMKGIREAIQEVRGMGVNLYYEKDKPIEWVKPAWSAGG